MISVERVLTGGNFANYASRGGGGVIENFIKKYTSSVVPRKSIKRSAKKCANCTFTDHFRRFSWMMHGEHFQ
jgi:hypothetical protein